jgi:tRNA(fMet)-specific endonuclease VapC
MYLLDTNHCSAAIRGTLELPDYVTALETAQLSTCVIVQGELIDMAARSQIYAANLILIEQFLQGLLIYNIDQTTATIYGNLKAVVFDRYAPKDKSQRRNTKITQLGFSENDLWIAAITIQYEFTLVSADRDFLRIQSVQSFSLESWI